MKSKWLCLIIILSAFNVANAGLGNLTSCDYLAREPFVVDEIEFTKSINTTVSSAKTVRIFPDANTTDLGDLAVVRDDSGVTICTKESCQLIKNGACRPAATMNLTRLRAEWIETSLNKFEEVRKSKGEWTGFNDAIDSKQSAFWNKRKADLLGLLKECADENSAPEEYRAAAKKALRLVTSKSGSANSASRGTK